MGDRLTLTEVAAAGVDHASLSAPVGLEGDERPAGGRAVLGRRRDPQPIVVGRRGVQRQRLGVAVAVDDEQFERPVVVEVDDDRARTEPVGFGRRAEPTGRPARALAVGRPLGDRREQPVLAVEDVDEQLLTAVVVEVGRHDGSDPCGFGERRRRAVDEPRFTRDEQVVGRRTVPDGQREAAVAGVDERRSAGGGRRRGDPTVGRHVGEVPLVVAEQSVGAALDADEDVHRVGHERRGHERPTAAGAAEADRVGHVGDLAVVAEFVTPHGRVVAGDEHTVAAGAEAVERRDRPTRPRVAPVGVDREPEGVTPDGPAVVFDPIEQHIGVIGVGGGVVDVELLGAVGIEVRGGRADRPAAAVGDDPAGAIDQVAVLETEQPVLTAAGDEHGGTASTRRDGRAVAVERRVRPEERRAVPKHGVGESAEG